RRYRGIVFDNRGVGRSDKPVGPYHLEQMAADATAVLDAAGVESAHVIGASMGGVIAQIMAVRSPERVRSLVLACTACRHLGWRRELLENWPPLRRAKGCGASPTAAFGGSSVRGCPGASCPPSAGLRPFPSARPRPASVGRLIP